MFKPITEFILSYIQSNPSRFHTPGHKAETDIFSKKVELFDITEIPGADNLLKSESIIKTSEAIASEIYGSNISLFSASGSTLCIQTMLFTVAKPGSKVIAMRNSHISFINTCCLVGLDPIWIYPEYNDHDGVSGTVNIEILERIIVDNPEVCCVYITSPDYLGVIQDISKISRLTRKYNLLLLVDNAHGAHLKFSNPDLHPISLGADICCDSLHKTLPALTGGAILHFKTKRFQKSQIKSNMAYFASTSPAYPILASIEYALEYLVSSFESDLRDIMDAANQLKIVAQQVGFKFLEVPTSPLHFSLNFSSIGVDTEQANLIFLKNNIQVEFVSSTHIVLLISKYNLKKDLDRLIKTIELFKSYRDILENKSPLNSVFEIEAPVKSISPRKATFAQSDLVDVDYCLGRIVAQTNFKCPPGIPLIMPGEVVNLCVLKHLKNSGTTKIKVVK